MGKIVRRETRKRGFFGWLFMTLFVAFNVLMLVWLIGYAGQVSSIPAESDAAQAGRAVGGAIGTGILLFFWVAGSVILGLFAILTRGRKTIIEEVEE